MKRILFILIMGVLPLVLLATTYKKEDSYVLILNSSSFSEVWIRHLCVEIENKLNQDYPQITIKREELGIPLIREEKKAEVLRQRLRHQYPTRPQLILFIGDPGHMVCAPLFDKEWKDVPTIVYSSCDRVPNSMQLLFNKETLTDSNSILAGKYYKKFNAARVKTPLYIKETIKVMQQVIPGMNRLLILSDNRFISTEMRKQADEVVEQYFPNIQLMHLRVGHIDTETLIKTVSRSGDHTGIIYYSWYSNLSEEEFHMEDNMQKVICAFSHTPVFALYEWDAEHSYCAGGHYIALKDNVEAVYDYVKQILNGKRASELPTLIVDDKAQTYLDYANLMWYGVNPENLPKNVIYLNVPPSFYQRYCLTIWLSSILIILLLSVFTYFKIRNMRQNRRSRLIAMRKREEEERSRLELEELTRKYRLVIQAVNLSTWTMDVNTNCVVYERDHRTLVEEMSLPKESNHNENLKLLVSEDRERVENAMIKLLNGESDLYHEQYRVCINNSQGYYWEESFAIVGRRESETGKPIMIVGASMRIDERKRMEENLIYAKERAEESDRLKSAFLANMSHEIRTPLNAIVGFSSILADTEDISERNEFYNIIKNNNDLLLQLINDILDLAKIEAGTLEFIYSQVDINELLQQIEQNFRFKIEDLDIELKIGEHEEECVITTERNRLTQVLSNFLTNALKFTPRGTITMGYRAVENDQLYFYVSDTGCGIPKDKQNLIFGRFMKLSNFSQGTGLGLSICETIINRLKGEIGVVSEIGEGSTFWFKIPRFPKEAMREMHVNLSENKAVDLVIADKEQIQKRKPVILIAEDNVGNYHLFESLLKKDYELIHAWDGKEAVELFKIHSPNLVLMDIMMPVLNGYEATAEIRKLSYIVPIIAVSAYIFEKDTQNFNQSNFSGYEPKPINPLSLTSKIAELLKKRMMFM